MMTVLALGAFQVLAIVGAGSAFAVTACTYNPATDTINITIDPTDDAEVAVETAAADLDAAADPGAILFSVNGGAFAACGSATNSNTVSIVVLGSPGTDEVFIINNFDGGEFNTAITWAIDLGTGVDILSIEGSDDTDDAVVLTDASFTLNGGGGELNGVELMAVAGNDGDDSIDGTGLVNSLLLVGLGGPGDDFIAPGPQATLPPVITIESVDGGAGVDHLSYATRTTSTVIDASAGLAGHDANADCDVVDAGDELDFVFFDFEILESGSGNDCLVGQAGLSETFIPGDGDDDITGNAGDGDVLDWSSSSAGMVIDPANETATGQGTDTFTDVFDFVGSNLDDVLIFDGTTNTFSGLDGTDTVDATADTGGVFIDLDALDPDPADDLENALGGSGNDVLIGNDVDNRLEGNDGDDELFGEDGRDRLFGGNGEDELEGGEGNDYLDGGEGDDEFTGDEGADTVSFGKATQGVEVDISLGFASGQGDDSFNDFVEIVVGSKFADDITGGQFGFGGSVNFRVKGRAGDDNITGSTSNDVLIGANGNDVIRGGKGDDTLKGGKGKNDRGFGGGGVDICNGMEFEKSCEI